MNKLIKYTLLVCFILQVYASESTDNDTGDNPEVPPRLGGLLGGGLFGQTNNQDLQRCRSRVRELQREIDLLTGLGGGQNWGGGSSSSSSDDFNNSTSNNCTTIIRDLRDEIDYLRRLLRNCTNNNSTNTQSCDSSSSSRADSGSCQERLEEIEDYARDLEIELRDCKNGEGASTSSEECAAALALLKQQNEQLQAQLSLTTQKLNAAIQSCVTQAAPALESMFKFESKNYFIFNGTTEVTHEAAQAACNVLGAQLVTITSVAELDALFARVSSIMNGATGLTSLFWTSGQDHDSDGVFHGATGEVLNTADTTLYPTAPTAGQCVGLEDATGAPVEGVLAGAACTATGQYICEWEGSCNALM